MNNHIQRPSENAADSLNRIEIDTPLGEMTAVFSRKGLCLLEFTDQQTLSRELQAVMKHHMQKIKTGPLPHTIYKN